jgi:hypothetical protein
VPARRRGRQPAIPIPEDVVLGSVWMSPDDGKRLASKIFGPEIVFQPRPWLRSCWFHGPLTMLNGTLALRRMYAVFEYGLLCTGDETSCRSDVKVGAAGRVTLVDILVNSARCTWGKSPMGPERKSF